MKHLLAVSLLVLSGGFAAEKAIVSPEVLADRRVTFRIEAPNARAVALKGDWQADAFPMARRDDGVWSVTVGPLAPATYIYSFTVDGVALADPVNPKIKLRMRGSGSLVDVPAAEPGLADARDVPHGAVELNWQKSSVLGDTRAIWVYTPPGYAADAARRYPVLYLLHGSNDRPAGWIDVGAANFIADNLLAAHKAAPMIIVMPVGHALPFGEPATPPRTNVAVFEDYLLRDVIPFIEGKYRIATDRRAHAVAGMSMGGEQALRIFCNHLDRFASAGIFSLGGAAPAEKDHPELFADGHAAATNARIDVLWLGCGRQDPGFARSEQTDKFFTAHGIRHTWVPSEGAHNYALWRQHVMQFLPLLFR